MPGAAEGGQERGALTTSQLVSWKYTCQPHSHHPPGHTHLSFLRACQLLCELRASAAAPNPLPPEAPPPSLLVSQPLCRTSFVTDPAPPGHSAGCTKGLSGHGTWSRLESQPHRPWSPSRLEEVMWWQLYQGQLTTSHRAGKCLQRPHDDTGRTQHVVYRKT